tara:strand:- start:277 stop:1464 length:1188 start_codon:yes stop_codon:yes gene_type:complete
MSSLLKDAIVDAKALRESALKNAETSIIEKYSEEVKQTLDQLLEQDEFGVEAESTSNEEVAKNIPLAATDNLSEEDGDIPENMTKEGEEVPVVIDLEALQEAVAALEAELDENEEIEITEEDLAEILAEDDEELEEGGRAARKNDPNRRRQDADRLREEDEEVIEEDDNDVQGSSEMADDEEDAGEAAAAQTAAAAEQDKEAMDEQYDADELVAAIMEKLTVDMGADLAGWAGRSSDDVKYQIEKEMAHRRSTDVEEELETLKKAQEELVFENKQLNEHLKQHKQVVGELKESLQDVNLSNARLLYTNRVLRNTSLNERQKEKIAEAISNAGSVTEAKVIFETLQSTVETKSKPGPKSLSEAIGNKRSSVIRATRKESTPSDPLQERMKRLAGIK